MIQCFVRQCFARQRVLLLQEARNKKIAMLTEREYRRLQLSEKKRVHDIDCRLHPKTTKDFEILYGGLENWRIQETNRINRLGYSEPARLAALADLLDQESALLQKIDRLKLSANDENREKSIVRLLENVCLA